ncbi:MAG: hypothetical protein ACYDEY_11335 [Acidimicrobiales bacterium]
MSGEELRESTVLSYKQGGKTKHLMLPAAEVEALRMATEYFRAAKSRVEAEGNVGLAGVNIRLARAKTRG